jgi:chromosome segregation protein
MGANSAKAMRAGGMDDVIFAGSGNRPRATTPKSR